MAESPNQWLMLTPAGALRAFGQAQPDAPAAHLQSLLAADRSWERQAWLQSRQLQPCDLDAWVLAGSVEVLPRPLQGPDARLDDFLQHVVAALSGERRAALASESGFCLGSSGMTQDEADALSAAAADFSEFARRQTRRGWAGASRYVAFHSDAEMLVPDTVMLPFWVDSVGYWLILQGEPLLNNPALVELVWGIQEAGSRFQPRG